MNSESKATTTAAIVPVSAAGLAGPRVATPALGATASLRGTEESLSSFLERNNLGMLSGKLADEVSLERSESD